MKHIFKVKQKTHMNNHKLNAAYCLNTSGTYRVLEKTLDTVLEE